MRTVATTTAIACAAVAVAAAAAGCGGTSTTIAVPGAKASNGPALIKAYGCGSCHTISGVDGADGNVGPSLAHLSDRRYIAGELPNTPPNLVRWIMAPQKVQPGTVMPDMGVDRQDARDIAAYLYRH
jgi:cytochrome c